MFQGSLEDIKLPDIIQLMSGGGKTGCFVLTSGKENAKIYLESGQIVHAQWGKFMGEDAIYSIAIWTSGQFVFQEDAKTETKTITKRNTNILMEVARKLEEWRVLKKKIPTLDLIPEFEALGNKKVSFNTQQWNVLAKIDGIKSVNQIALDCNMIAIDVAKLIYGLVASGLVSLRETPKPEPDPNPMDQSRQTSGAPPVMDEKAMLLNKVEKIYRASKARLSELAQPVIQRHCSQAVKDVNNNKGLSAVMEAATQIVKAAQILEGPEKGKELSEVLKKVLQEK